MHGRGASIRRPNTGLLVVGCLALGAGVWAQQPPAGAASEPKPAPAAAPQPTPPKPVITCKEKRLTARAKDSQLENLLEEIALACGVPVILGGDVGEERVSVEINDFPVDEALRQILARYDAFYLYEAAGEPAAGRPDARGPPRPSPARSGSMPAARETGWSRCRRKTGPARGSSKRGSTTPTPQCASPLLGAWSSGWAAGAPTRCFRL